ncbi:MAG: HAMP domain-containing histidine kinase [Candidatus Kapabacteria bacterium]|nr:HAMP domain-containing histidine kinase [Candidatus Kapabacteria bacterium]
MHATPSNDTPISRIQHQADVLSLLAHDLRGSLANVHAALHEAIACLNDAVEPDTVTLLTDSELAIERMIDAVASMMVLARADRLQIDMVDLGFVLPDILDQHRPHADEKQIVLDGPDTTGDLPWLMADSTVLGVILGNLVSNAVKYSPNGSTVRICASSADDGVAIDVIDEGPGIPPEDVERLFEQPGTLSTRPTGGESSTGLGLYLCARLAKRMGARLMYAAADQGGTKMTLLCSHAKHS